jgi:hypothetical protein
MIRGERRYAGQGAAWRRRESPGVKYNRMMGVALIRFVRFLAWADLASIPVIYWTRSELVWVFGPYGMTALWWFCGFAVACSLVVLVKFRPRRRPAAAQPGAETLRRRGVVPWRGEARAAGNAPDLAGSRAGKADRWR